MWWVVGDLVESAPLCVVASSACCRLSACCPLTRTTLERCSRTQGPPCRCVRRVSLRPPGVAASASARDFFFFFFFFTRGERGVVRCWVVCGVWCVVCVCVAWCVWCVVWFEMGAC